MRLNLHSVLVCFAMAVPAQAQHPGSVPAVGTIISRMSDARAENRAQFRPYKVVRDYKLYGTDPHVSKAEIVVDVRFVPPNQKQFTIKKASGWRLGERIVRQMLEGETAAVKEYGSTDITPANYDFQFVGEEEVNGRRCYVLGLIPKRKDSHLLLGKIWVDAKTYLLHHFRGEPAKSVSWLLRGERIAFAYGDVDGMWLQTSFESKASVRIFGAFTMISRDVEYQIRRPDAATGGEAWITLSMANKKN